MYWSFTVSSTEGCGAAFSQMSRCCRQMLATQSLTNKFLHHRPLKINTGLSLCSTLRIFVIYFWWDCYLILSCNFLCYHDKKCNRSWFWNVGPKPLSIGQLIDFQLDKYKLRKYYFHKTLHGFSLYHYTINNEIIL